jgi:hypothetical protein
LWARSSTSGFGSQPCSSVVVFKNENTHKRTNAKQVSRQARKKTEKEASEQRKAERKEASTEVKIESKQSRVHGDNNHMQGGIFLIDK